MYSLNVLYKKKFRLSCAPGSFYSNHSFKMERVVFDQFNQEQAVIFTRMKILNRYQSLVFKGPKVKYP